MQLTLWRFALNLAHPWRIARTAATRDHGVVFVRLTDAHGRTGLGEAAPTECYGETVETVEAFLGRVEPARLSFDDIPASMAYLETLAPGHGAAKTCLNLALVDGAARAASQPVYDFFGLGFTEGKHLTSFTIGIDTPAVVREKVRAAAAYPVLKLKVGVPEDRANLAALREVAPDRPVRLDANEGWKTKEQALRAIEWLAQQGPVQFVEQPLPADTAPEDLVWLKERSPLPLFADESYHHAADAPRCAACYHGVNVKLVKTGGLTGAYQALQAARRLGLKTMIGCMIESSLLISAGAHLAELADYLDLDGNLLITNDPFAGVTAEAGVLSFARAPEPFGLRVRARE